MAGRQQLLGLLGTEIHSLDALLQIWPTASSKAARGNAEDESTSCMPRAAALAGVRALQSADFEAIQPVRGANEEAHQSSTSLKLLLSICCGKITDRPNISSLPFMHLHAEVATGQQHISKGR